MTYKTNHASVIERLCRLFDSTGVCDISVMPYEGFESFGMRSIRVRPSEKRPMTPTDFAERVFEGEFELVLRAPVASPEDSLALAELGEALLSAAMNAGERDGVRVVGASAVYEKESAAEGKSAVYGATFVARSVFGEGSGDRAVVCISSERERLRLAHTGTCRIVKDGLRGFDCPELDVEFAENALHNGSQPLRQRIGTRFFDVTFEVSDRAVFPQVRSKVQRLMNPSDTLTVKVNLFGRRRIIEAVPGKSPEISYRGGVYKIKLYFASKDPFFTDGEEKCITFPPEDGVLSFPASLMKGAGTAVSFTSDSAWHTVVNEGEAPVGFVFTFRAVDGDVRNPKIQLGSSTLMYLGTLYQGSELVFDTRYGTKKVLLDGRYTYDVPRNSDFFELAPGENRLLVNSSDGPVNFEATLRYTPRYMGA